MICGSVPSVWGMYGEEYLFGLSCDSGLISGEGVRIECSDRLKNCTSFFVAI